MLLLLTILIIAPRMPRYRASSHETPLNIGYTDIQKQSSRTQGAVSVKKKPALARSGSYTWQKAGNCFVAHTHTHARTHAHARAGTWTHVTKIACLVIPTFRFHQVMCTAGLSQNLLGEVLNYNIQWDACTEVHTLLGSIRYYSLVILLDTVERIRVVGAAKHFNEVLIVSDDHQLEVTLSLAIFNDTAASTQTENDQGMKHP